MDESHSRLVESAYGQRDSIVRSVASRFAGADAEEHVAEAYAQCCDAKVNDVDHAVRWVARAATNLAIDAQRADTIARRHAPQLVTPVSTQSAEDRYLETELHSRVATALAALPPYQREVLQAYAEGARNGDIARRVGRSVDAVKQVISRGLKQLREELREVELALIALWTRRRRTNSVTVGAASPALALSGPAMAAVLNAAVPLLGCLVAFMLSTSPASPDPLGASSADHVTPATTAEVEGTVRAPSRANPRPAPMVAWPRALEPAQEAADARLADAARRVPPSSSINAAGHSVERRRTDRNSEVKYTPDHNDPVGDLTYCVTHPIVTPNQIACEQPP